jgi:hypothetical protein
MMVAGLLLVLLVAGDPGAQFDRDAARAELSAIAGRIEELKARHATGDDGVHPELHRLLVRAQELAQALEADAGRPPPRMAALAVDELRERADAARDEADRLRTAIARLNARMAEIEAGARLPQARFASAGGGGGEVSPAQRLAALEAQRTSLVHRLALATAEAERLEAEARAIETGK